MVLGNGSKVKPMKQQRIKTLQLQEIAIPMHETRHTSRAETVLLLSARLAVGEVSDEKMKENFDQIRRGE